MAIVEFGIPDLENLIGRKLSKKDLEETIPMMGCPLEKIDGSKVLFEVFPDRPDMLSAEGFSRAVKTFLGQKPKTYSTKPGSVKLKVDPSVKTVRPCIGAAVVRNLNFTQGMVESLMQVQEKIHETLGRKRWKVAIGIHNLENVTSPFIYKAVNPTTIKFVPLGKSVKMNMKEICEKHEKGAAHSIILKKHKKWPIIVDKNKEILSFPPIINGELTKVTMQTKNLFIDVTGTEQDTVNQALNIIVTSLADRGGVIETVAVNGKPVPNLDPVPMKINKDYVNKLLDLDLTENEISKHLEKMGIGFNPKTKNAQIPAYRCDIMHEIDLVEEIAIAHGYHKFEPRIPKVPTIAKRLKRNEEDKILRRLLVGLGFQEIKAMVLSNQNNQFTKMRTKGKAVELANSVTAECTIARTWLVPSLLKTFTQNMHREYPQRIFELGECITLDVKSDTATKNIRKIAVGISGNTATYEDISSSLSAFFSSIGTKLTLIPNDHPSFIRGRCAAIVARKTHVGVVGEINPTVLTNWGLEKPVAAFEIVIDKIRD